MASRRSTIAFIAAGAGIVIGFQNLPRLRELLRAQSSDLSDFEPLDSPAGFRRMAGGASSTGAFDPLVGLDDGRDRGDAALDEQVRSNLCRALYGEAVTNAGTVPIASFSDYYCPYCRVQTRRLAQLEEELGGRVDIAWHELPLLGETSELAARAALAAKRQGAYAAFQDSLLTSAFRASPEYLASLSERIGVDADQLMRDMDSEDVRNEVATSLSLSRIFGFIGTPAMVVGRTVIQGEVSDATLRRLVDIEREEGWTAIC